MVQVVSASQNSLLPLQKSQSSCTFYNVPDITHIAAKDDALNIKCIFACKCKINVSNICLRNVSILKTFKEFEFISTYQYYSVGIMVQVRKIAQNHSAFDTQSTHITGQDLQTRSRSGRKKASVVDTAGLIFLKIKPNKTRNSASFS